MTDRELVVVDTSLEAKIASLEPGARQRALAVTAFKALSEMVGQEPSIDTITHLRSLSRAEAKATQKALKIVRGLFETQQSSTADVLDVPEASLSIEDPEVKPEGELSVSMEVSEEGAPETAASVAGLNKRATNWLKGIIEEDPSTLTVDDIPRIKDMVKKARGPLGSRVKLDYDALIEGLLRGIDFNDLADQLNSTPGSLQLTLSNYKKAIQKQSTGLQVDTAAFAAPHLPLVVAPRPQPPHIRLETASRPVAPTQVRPSITQPKHTVPTAEHLTRRKLDEARATIHRAVDEPNLVGVEEWMSEAGLYIETVAARTIRPDQAAALWQHLHFDDDAQYRHAPDSYKAALDQLRPRLRVVAKDLENGSINKTVLNCLFNSSVGYKTLDDLHELLVRRDSTITKNLTQRHAVLAVMTLLER